MHILRTVRWQPAWSRALLVGFVLAFGLNSIAHTSHRHEPASPSTSLHSTACGYCLTFDHLTGWPVHVTADVSHRLEIRAVVVAAEPLLLLRPHSSAQPRAPPILIEA